MWNRKELKAKGKAAFKRNYWPSVLVALVLTLVTGGGAGSAYKRSHSQGVTTNLDVSNMTTEQAIAILATIAIASLVFILILVLVDMFITNPLSVGAHRFFVRNSEGDRPGFSMLFSAYQDGHFGRVFVTMFLRDLYIFLWSLLLVIPGMIKAYSYRMVPYLLADHPEMSASEIITKSREMMNGHKWKSFVLDLSFILWYILVPLTFGLVGVFYVGPYVAATNAELYEALKA